MAQLTETRSDVRYTLSDLTELQISLLSELIDNLIAPPDSPKWAELSEDHADLQSVLHGIAAADFGYMERPSWIYNIESQWEHDGER